MSSAAEITKTGTLVETAVSVPLSSVHILELGHKSSYFQSTNRLDLCPLLVSVSFNNKTHHYNDGGKNLS